MRIGLDARSLSTPRPRGTGRNLRDAYRLIPALRQHWQFILYHQRPADDGLRAAGEPGAHPNVRLRQIDFPGDRFQAWFHVRLPAAAWRDGVDLLHFPANAAPCWCPVPFVVTIHDLIPLKLPGELSARQTRAFRRGVSRAVRGAAHIITVSEATRADLRDVFGVPPERMTVVPWAPDRLIASAAKAPRTAEQIGLLRERYGLAKRWLISFPGSTARKNARGLLAGLARVAPEVRQTVQVVLAGCEPAAQRTQLELEAQRRGLAANCRVLGFVPHTDLPELLRGAAGLLIPSRYEGFGLPILDAFTCGVPVLTSRVSSMPEVAGDAAVYCDPDDPASIAAGITRLLDPTIAAQLVELGRERVVQFSWERTAEAMCAVYEQCVTGERPAPSVAARFDPREGEAPAEPAQEACAECLR